jgi:small subunit ribosomal protein S10
MTTTETKIKKVKDVTKALPKKAKKAVSAKDKEKKGDENVVLRIRVRAYESKILDTSVKQIMDTAMRYDAVIVGPVPLPTEIKKYTVNRASFVYKNTREQFEIRVHKRLIDIINPGAKTIEALTNLSLPSGVDIDVKML